MAERKVYVTAYSSVAKAPQDEPIRGCVMTLSEDYDLAGDAEHWFTQLRENFYEAVKDQCTCRHQYDQFLPEYTIIIGVSPLD